MKLQTIAVGIAFAACLPSCSSEVASPSPTGETAQAMTNPPLSTNAPQLSAANHYELVSGDLHVTYARFANGTAVFIYRDAEQTRVFRDDEIHTASTEAGVLASVILFRTIDNGSISFSVLVPRVSVDARAPSTVRTHAITTVHQFSVLPLPAGQHDDFTITPMLGTATHADEAAIGRL